MADAVGIAGLAISVFDQLLKLGERTIELAHDIKCFEKDLQDAGDVCRRQHWRTRSLKFLLLEKSPMNNDKTLYEQFDEEAREEIKILVSQLSDDLSRVSDLFERRLSLEQSVPNSWGKNIPPFTASNTSLTQQRSFSSTAFLASSIQFATKVTWSVHYKKKALQAISEYERHNEDLRILVETYAFASNFGLSLSQLERLQSNPSAKDLGMNDAANLRLCQLKAEQGTVEGMELKFPLSSSPTANIQVEEKFTVLMFEQRKMLQEMHEAREESEVNPITRLRLDSLATLLRQPKEQIFRVPRCAGWQWIPSSNSVAFMFEYPGATDTMPTSLLKALSSDYKPELGDKYALALALARSLGQLQTVQWVHQSIRSENILFFHKENPGKSILPYGEPWVCGFDYSRREDFFSRGLGDIRVERDVYRHPDRQRNPEKIFNKYHDIYSLGVVLLEIGLWETAISQQHPSQPFQSMSSRNGMKDRLLKVARARIPSRMGKAYLRIVEKCLTGDFDIHDNTKEDVKLQQAFRAQVIGVLDEILEKVS